MLFGVPPEEDLALRHRPGRRRATTFCYAFGANFKAIQYVRLDPVGTGPSDVVNQVRTHRGQFPVDVRLRRGSFDAQAAAAGRIPLPALGEKVQGGHAVVAIGYDDTLQITNHAAGGVTTTGAFKIRNSSGHRMGRGRLRLDSLRLRRGRDRPGLVDAGQGGVGRQPGVYFADLRHFADLGHFADLERGRRASGPLGKDSGGRGASTSPADSSSTPRRSRVSIRN